MSEADDKIDRLLSNLSGTVTPELVARFRDKATTTIRIVPSEGCLLTAETVGGMIVNLAKLLHSIGRDFGIKTTAFIRNVEMGADGSVEVSLMLTRTDSRGRPKAHAPKE